MRPIAPETLHQIVDGLPGLIEVRIALFDVAHGHAVRAEYDVDSRRILIGELSEFLHNRCSKRVEVVRVIVPLLNNSHVRRGRAICADEFVHPIKARPGGRNRKLRIQRQNNEMSYAVTTNLFDRIFEKRVPVTHANIGSRDDVARNQGLFKCSSLLVRYSSKRRSAPNLLVVPARKLMTLS